MEGPAGNGRPFFFSLLYFQLIMAGLTDYQRQAKRRIKKALKRRYSADFKARSLAARLAVALADAATANTRIAAVNALYGTTFQGLTTLVQALNTAGLPANVNTALAGSVAGSPGQAYSVAVANVGTGQELAADADLD